MSPRTCPRCAEVALPDAQICQRCGSPLVLSAGSLRTVTEDEVERLAELARLPDEEEIERLAERAREANA